MGVSSVSTVEYYYHRDHETDSTIQCSIKPTQMCQWIDNGLLLTQSNRRKRGRRRRWGQINQRGPTEKTKKEVLSSTCGQFGTGGKLQENESWSKPGEHV